MPPYGLPPIYSTVRLTPSPLENPDGGRPHRRPVAAFSRRGPACPLAYPLKSECSTSGCCQHCSRNTLRCSRAAALLGSRHGLVWDERHPVAYRHKAQARPTSAGACANSAPTPRRPAACGRQLQALRATMQRIAAALATRSVVLVDVAPVGIELFLQYQQSCRLGQGLVFTTQLLL